MTKDSTDQHRKSGPRWRRNPYCEECHQPWPCPTIRTQKAKEANGG